jgi:WD40 repeat protein
LNRKYAAYSFDHRFGLSRSLYFPVQDQGPKCIVITETGSLIRTWWNDLSDIESHILDMPGLGEVWTSAFSHCGSLLAAVSPDGSPVSLYDMTTMTVVNRRLYIHRNMPSGSITVYIFHPVVKCWSYASTLK